MNCTTETHTEKSYSPVLPWAIATILIGPPLFQGMESVVPGPSPEVVIDRSFGPVYLEGQPGSESTLSQWFYSDDHASTWRPVDTPPVDVEQPINVHVALSLINSMAFLPIDEEANQRVEQHFAKKPFVGKTVFVNKRINRS
jgi:hypothetical protein